MTSWLEMIFNLVGILCVIQLWVSNRQLKAETRYLQSELYYINKALMGLTEKYEDRTPDSSKTIKDGLAHGQNNTTQPQTQKKRTKQKRHWQR